MINLRNKRNNILILTTVSFFLFGILLLIIGMCAKATYLVESSYLEGYKIKLSVTQVINELNFLSIVNPELILIKLNLFNFHSYLIDILNILEAQPIGTVSIEELDFYSQLLNLANTAIAGFSFIIISIFTGFVTFGFFYHEYYSSKNIVKVIKEVEEKK